MSLASGREFTRAATGFQSSVSGRDFSRAVSSAQSDPGFSPCASWPQSTGRGPTSLGSGIFALLAAGAYSTIEEAQAAVCLPLRTVNPDPKSAAVYEQRYHLYRDIYFALGTRTAAPLPLGRILPDLRRIAAEVRKAG